MPIFPLVQDKGLPPDPPFLALESIHAPLAGRQGPGHKGTVFVAKSRASKEVAADVFKRMLQQMAAHRRGLNMEEKPIVLCYDGADENLRIAADPEAQKLCVELGVTVGNPRWSIEAADAAFNGLFVRQSFRDAGYYPFDPIMRLQAYKASQDVPNDMTEERLRRIIVQLGEEYGETGMLTEASCDRLGLPKTPEQGERERDPRKKNLDDLDVRHHRAVVLTGHGFKDYAKKVRETRHAAAESARVRKVQAEARRQADVDRLARKHEEEERAQKLRNDRVRTKFTPRSDDRRQCAECETTHDCAAKYQFVGEKYEWQTCPHYGRWWCKLWCTRTLKALNDHKRLCESNKRPAKASKGSKQPRPAPLAAVGPPEQSHHKKQRTK